jgi:uncharacterized membrane protein
MMEKLLRRGEEIASAAQQRKVQQLAQQLAAMVGGGAIEIQESAVLVRGRGLARRWLTDPALRFLSGGLK